MSIHKCRLRTAFGVRLYSKMCNEIIPYQYEVLNDEIERDSEQPSN